VVNSVHSSRTTTVVLGGAGRALLRGNAYLLQSYLNRCANAA